MRVALQAVLLVAVAAAASGCNREPQITAEIVAAGTSKPHLGWSVEAPETALGEVNATAPGLVEIEPTGTHVRAALGTSFGIRVVLHGRPRGSIVELRTRVTHPPTVNPAAGTSNTVEEWDTPMDFETPRYTGWGFEQPWELVPGNWRIELVDRGRTLAKQDFTLEVVQ